MSGEIRFDTEIEYGPEGIGGHDFRVSSIRWNGNNFKLQNLHLPNDWEIEIPRLSETDPGAYCTYLETLCRVKGLNWELHLDKKTGLITEVKLNNNKEQSNVRLNMGFVGSGTYDGENIRELGTAIIYQEFLGKYLDWVTNLDISHSYICDNNGEGYFSSNLCLPREIIDIEEPITNKYYQQMFELKASNIAGQFGEKLENIKFDENGILKTIQIDMGKDCNYSLDSCFGKYGPHNVDTQYEAATLHGIAAEFINNLLERNSEETS